MNLKIQMRKEKKEIDTVLGQPIFAELSEETTKTRRNLIIFSSIALAIVIHDLKINSANASGIVITNLNTEIVLQSLFGVILYLLLHFWFQIDDLWHSWRIRITGTRLTHVTTGITSSRLGDYPNDPSQSSLYGWWQAMKKSLQNHETLASNLNSDVKKLEEIASKLISAKLTGNIPDGKTLATEYNNTKRSLDQTNHELKKCIENIQTIITSERIEHSLNRFNLWFGNFQYSQLVRLFLIEISFPIIIGIFAIILTTPFSAVGTILLLISIALLPFVLSRALKHLSN